ncbi:MAG TPA: hypothetical protein VMJ12_18340, partial [Candidatus Acidoferrales bacterium]|nr:hypothetical protein [Candidatus Acidoferrales bacterium]
MNLAVERSFSDPMTYLYPHDDLGAVYRPQATTLKLWAPTATNVQVMLFDDATNPSPALQPMVRDSKGIWSAALNGDLAGKYYLYQVALPGGNGRAPVVAQVNDPYAHG